MKQEKAVEEQILRELLALKVPEEMLRRGEKRSSGVIDILIYTQPPCIIEVKAILDGATLKKAIKQLGQYQSSFPRARLFIAGGLLKVEPWAARAEMRRRGVRLWTSGTAKDIAQECMATPLERAAVSAGNSLKLAPQQPAKPGAEDFFQRTANMAYTTWARNERAEKALRAVRTLPVSEQEEASVALARLGKRKAAILAAALKRQPQNWREIIEHAYWYSEEALQRQITRDYGLKPRGPRRPGKRLYDALMDALPLERRVEVAAVLEDAFRLAGSDDFVDAFLRIVEEAKTRVRQQARYEEQRAVDILSRRPALINVTH